MKRAKKTKETKNSQEKKEENKNEPEIQEASIKKNLKKRQNKQIMWAVILMIGLILIIILVPVIKNAMNKFVYINLNFQKTQLGEKIYYSTRVPVADRTGKLIGDYSMNFKNDPRKLEVNNTISDNMISFVRDKTVFITVSPEMETCGLDNFIALSDLSGFLKDFAQLDVQAGVTDKKYAQSNNLTYATCKNYLTHTVIYFNSGNVSKITKINDNCYELIYKDCEILPVTEKFMLIILEKYMSYFTRKTSVWDIFK